MATSKLDSDVFNEINHIITLAVNNQINEAIEKFTSKANISTYHSYGLSFINLLDMISLDPEKVIP